MKATPRLDERINWSSSRRHRRLGAARVWLALILVAAPLGAQPFVRTVGQLRESRFAEWIAWPDAADTGPVVLFRRTLTLAEVPTRFLVHVSGDYAYRLYVNGHEVSWGPAAADLSRWNYETVDLAPWLGTGENVLAAQVWRETDPAAVPARQISSQLAFILQGDTALEQAANTNATWKVAPNRAITSISHRSNEVGGGYIAGATDRIDGARYPWGWNDRAFDDSGWRAPRELGKGNHVGLNTWLGTPWLLRARSLPSMEERDEPVGRVIRAEGVAVELGAELVGSIKVPAQQRATLLIDHGVLTMGIPRIQLSGGAGATVTLRYQEALFGPTGRKGDRNAPSGKVMRGYYDEIAAEGGAGRWYAPRWIRTFRYLEVQVTTGEEALEIQALRHRFTAYPFVERGVFAAGEPWIDAIWEASWRTARLCALDTYMDCPYYEQLQYIGDTRLQALISYYVAGDARLARQALEAFGASLQPIGLTKSSHPSGQVQIIPPFSLLYLAMLHDYWMMTEDAAWVREQLAGARFILEWFLSRRDRQTGLLGPLPYWNHVDGGVAEFAVGSPPGAATGGSAHLSLLLAYALDRVSELVEPDGRAGESAFYRTAASQLKEAVQRHCWDAARQLFVETPGGQLATMHTNSLAMLADAAPVPPGQLADRMLADSEVVQPTLYFEFYAFEALARAGRGDQVLPRLRRWQSFLEQGLSTFPEHGVESRSDCHAWSAHPLHALLAITAGVRSARPGFAEVVVAPHPGSLREFRSVVPHPRGEIVVRYDGTGAAERYSIALPPGVTGRFHRGGIDRALPAGVTELEVPRAIGAD